MGATGSLSYRVLGPNELSSHTHSFLNNQYIIVLLCTRK